MLNHFLFRESWQRHSWQSWASIWKQSASLRLSNLIMAHLSRRIPLWQLPWMLSWNWLLPRNLCNNFESAKNEATNAGRKPWHRRKSIGWMKKHDKNHNIPDGLLRNRAVHRTSVPLQQAQPGSLKWLIWHKKDRWMRTRLQPSCMYCIWSHECVCYSPTDCEGSNLFIWFSLPLTCALSVPAPF